MQNIIILLINSNLIEGIFYFESDLHCKNIGHYSYRFLSSVIFHINRFPLFGELVCYQMKAETFALQDFKGFFPYIIFLIFYSNMPHFPDYSIWRTCLLSNEGSDICPSGFQRFLPLYYFPYFLQ